MNSFRVFQKTQANSPSHPATTPVPGTGSLCPQGSTLIVHQAAGQLASPPRPRGHHLTHCGISLVEHCSVHTVRGQETAVGLVWAGREVAPKAHV